MTQAQKIKKLKERIRFLNRCIDDQANVNKLLVAALIKMAEIKKRKKK